jgi:hypothetical protein
LFLIAFPEFLIRIKVFDLLIFGRQGSPGREDPIDLHTPEVQQHQVNFLNMCRDVARNGQEMISLRA